MEGAEAFVNIHNETGVLGIAGPCLAQTRQWQYLSSLSLMHAAMNDHGCGL